MSVRALGTRLFKHGVTFVRTAYKRDLNTTNITNKINAAQHIPSTPTRVSTGTQIIPRNFVLRNVGVQIGLQARRILIDNVLNRVTNSLAADLRKKAARRILYGDSGPFFALVGVSLASGTGILTKEEELEGVCWEIREAISKLKWNYHDDDIDDTLFEDKQISVNDLSFGKFIARGSNAVVHAVKLNKNTVGPNENDLQSRKIRSESEDSIEQFPLAVKMLFNFSIQSSSMAILKGMYRETVPARIFQSGVGMNDWEIDLSSRKRQLPPHPNVVAIYSVFTDYIPELEDCRELYPAALPARIHPDGHGRNMSLFLLMKRYNTNLEEYLKVKPSLRTSIILSAQLLEGIAHLTAHGVSHRDLKSDNLLLDTTEHDVPVLVISDFGCCLADKSNGLMLPYTSMDVDKGGNTALMAPEIINQRPGTFSVLNYSKSDLWAAGAIIYQIFGCTNPFYGDSLQKKLLNVNYNEDELPEMPQEVPVIFRELTKNLLKRNPNKRLNPEVAANVCQLYLWGPSSWLKPGNIKLPSSAEILQWLLSLTTKMLCAGQISNKTLFSNQTFETNVQKSGRRTYPEYLLISSFLSRAKIANIRSALLWIHNNVYDM